MIKWLRPGGAAAFLVVIVFIALFWWLLADWLIKAAVEEGGTRLVGAKVELQEANLTFSPLGVHLSGLQVTDPDQPMQNMIEVANLQGALKMMPLLMGQVAVEELQATGVRFNTPRTSSGAIIKEKKASSSKEAPVKEEGADLSLVTKKLPSVDDLLTREPLLTEARVSAFSRSVEEQRLALSSKIDALPDKARIAGYQQRIHELTDGRPESVTDLQKRKQELEKLKQEIKNDKERVNDVRDQLGQTRHSLAGMYADLKAAPAADVAHLKRHYSFDSGGVGNITGLIFGDEAAGASRLISSWGSRVQAILPAEKKAGSTPIAPPRGEGRFIHFTSNNPRPDFWIQHARLGVELPVGDISLRLDDVTSQPEILGRPMRLQARADHMQRASHLAIDGIFDHVHPQAPRDTLQWDLAGWQLNDVALSGDSSLPLTLVGAVTDIRGQVTLQGRSLDAESKATFNNAHWRSDAKEGWAQKVVQTLATLQQFQMDVALKGDVAKPGIKLSSDLDERLKQAFKQQLQAREAELEQQLKARLNAKLQTVAGEYQQQADYLDGQEGGLKQQVASLDEMLQAQLQSLTDNKKQETEQKLKGKLKGLKF